LTLQQLELKSNYPVRTLGHADTSTVYLTEEERENHTHILGTTGEGKSKFLEYLIREDIDKGKGVCLLDPTDRGETAYSILRYCALKGHDKVCLIDPFTIIKYNKASCIQPFDYHKSYQNASIANLMDTVRVMFMTKDSAETPRIQRYLSAILNVIWNAGSTLHEAVYFSDHSHPLYQKRRREILDHSHSLDRHRLALEEVFKSRAMFLNEFQSTIRRMEPFFDSQIDLMLGMKEGIPFTKMITEGWVILVNLYSGLGVEPIHTRLLGTLVINEIIFALDRLRNSGWKGIYYLYIDEAGRYANRNLADLLAYKRKSGLRVTVAHQYFGQFEDRYVLEAIKQLTKIKMMFNTPGHSDRLEMVKSLGYGGDIPAVLAQYANADLPKQVAIIKKGKDKPLRIRIPDVPDIKLDHKVEEAFILKCLSHPWNYSREEIREQMNGRFLPTPHPKSPQPGKTSNRQATRKTAVPRTEPESSVPASGEEPPKTPKRRPIKI
jgi:hypothetical protein